MLRAGPALEGHHGDAADRPCRARRVSVATSRGTGEPLVGSGGAPAAGREDPVLPRKRARDPDRAQGGSTRSESLTVADLGVLERVAISLHGLVFYLERTLLPVDLSPFYPLKTPVDPFAATYLTRAAVVAAITGLAILARRRWPAVSAAWVVYVVTVLPVSGIFQNGPQMGADRYSYLPVLPLAVLAGAGVLAVWRAGDRGPYRVLGLATGGVAVLLVTLLATLTWRQVG